MVTRETVQATIYDWAVARETQFTAPCGILKGDHGKYLSVSFGIARIVDVEVRIYSPRWLLLRSSLSGTQQFASLDALLADLELRYP